MARIISILVAASVIVFALSGIPARAGSDADALLNALGSGTGTGTESTKAVREGVFASGALKLTNPVSRQVFSDVSAREGDPKSVLTIDVRAWFQKFISDDFTATAHLWTAVSRQMPDPLVPASQAAFLYSLYRLGLNQTFFDQWVQTLSGEAFRNSRASMALEESLATGFEDFLWKGQISIYPEQRAVLASMSVDRSPIFLSLEAYQNLRKGRQGETIIAKLPADSRFRPLLAQSITLSLAREGHLSEAARMLKAYYDPWLAEQKNAGLQTRYSLQIARLLYQIGSMEGAAQNYLKVPRGSPDFLLAQEELGWVYLRMGQTQRLRGILESFNSGAFKNEFRPEVRVLQSISDLKLCHYADTARVIQEYVRENKGEAAQIDSALALENPPSPARPDEFADRAAGRVTQRLQEKERLERLADQSIGAALPSVGRQQHWVDASHQMALRLEASKKELAAEYRRLWKARFNELQEATKKLQFVRVELMTQVARLKSGSGPVTAKPTGQKEAIESRRDQQVFPHDRVMWPDELFQLRSLTNSTCTATNTI